MSSKHNANVIDGTESSKQTPLPSTWWPFSSYKNILEVSFVASNLYLCCKYSCWLSRWSFEHNRGRLLDRYSPDFEGKGIKVSHFRRPCNHLDTIRSSSSICIQVFLMSCSKCRARGLERSKMESSNSRRHESTAQWVVSIRKMGLLRDIRRDFWWRDIHINAWHRLSDNLLPVTKLNTMRVLQQI